MLWRLLIAALLLPGCIDWWNGGYGSCDEIIDAGADLPDASYGPGISLEPAYCSRACAGACSQLRCGSSDCFQDDAGSIHCAGACARE
jgi:hypothetical protein